MRALAMVCFLLLGLIGCGDNQSPEPGTTSDSGVRVDATIEVDAGDVDAGPGDLDAGEPSCTGGTFEGDACVCAEGSHRCASGCCPWVIEDVDTEGFAGGTTSIQLDAAGWPHVSYVDTRTDRLRYGRYDGTTWTRETVDEPRVGWHSSLALDASGVPHISYYAPAAGQLKYAVRTGGTWTIEVVDDTARAVGRMTSIALDAAGVPHVSYHDTTNDDLKYAHRTGGSWTIEAVDSADSVGDFTSLALDRDGRPHIVYHHILDASGRDPGNLKYARLTDSGWVFETVDRGDRVTGWFTSIALDDDDLAHVSYYDETNRHLRYARRMADGSWELALVDDAGDVGDARTSLALDAAGRPHVTYHDADADLLKYAFYTGERWVVHVVADEAFSGRYSALALGANDAPHISYSWRNDDSPMPAPGVQIHVRWAH